MPRTLAELPSGIRITDYISLGVLAKTFPSGKVQEILQQSGKASIRERDMPAQVVIYYVIRSRLVYAVFLPRGASLPFGGSAVVGRSSVYDQSYGQSGDFTSPEADGLRAAKAVA
jgi:hypothetical protein